MRDGLIILLIFAIISFSLPLITVQEAKVAAVFPEEITLLREKTGEIVTLSGKDYIKGCISAQIPIDYEQQALNAQAAAAATYALRLMADTRESEAPWGEADLSDSAAACQSYFDYEECIESYGEEYNEFLPKIEAAATFGLSHVITSGSELAVSYFPIIVPNTSYVSSGLHIKFFLRLRNLSISNQFLLS